MNNKIIVSFEEYKNLLGMMLSDEDNDDLLNGMMDVFDTYDDFTYWVKSILIIYFFYKRNKVSYMTDNFVNIPKRNGVYESACVESEAWNDYKYIKYRINDCGYFDTRVVDTYFKAKYSL